MFNCIDIILAHNFYYLVSYLIYKQQVNYLTSYEYLKTIGT